MEPKFQTSFIPKRNIESGSDRGVSRDVDDTNIFTLGATIIFIFTVLIAGGLFTYKGILLKQLDMKGKEVDAARSAIEPDKIKDILEANYRIQASKNLLDNHQVTSGLLVLLGQLAIKNIQFNSLSYQNKIGGPSINIKSEVRTYNALAYQQEVMLKNELLRQVTFSDVALGENGSIRFSISARLDPNLVSYKKLLESLSFDQ